jgi:chromosome segregation ATPase
MLERAYEQRRHLSSLRDELAEVRSENDQLRAALQHLRSQATASVRREDDLRAEAEDQRDRAAAALAARSDLERRLVEVEDQLRSATVKSDLFESAAQAARDRLAAFEYELAQKSTHGDGELDEARLRIEKLTGDLHWACNANARLRSLLNVFGIVDHLESP